jgi:signal transduction histidine kinase/CheY-like chemotaxis protein
MSDQHRLLRRQIARHLRDRARSTSVSALLRDVERTYQQADGERARLERSLELTSEELLARNAELVRALDAERARRTVAGWYHRALGRYATLLAQEQDLDCCLTTICDDVRETLAVERVAVWTFDEQGHAMLRRALSTSGPERPSMPAYIAANYPTYFSALSSARIVAVHDIASDPVVHELRDYFGARGITSCITAPCRIAGHIVGMVTIGHTGAIRTWSAEDEQFCASVADCVSLVLESDRRRRVEEERAALEADLRQSQRMESLGMVAGGIAHDFNNLLVPIIGNAEYGLELIDDGEMDPELLVEIREAAISARDLVAQLLAFSRKQVLQLRAVDLDDEIRKLARLLGRALPENIALDLRLDGGATVCADAGQLKQVVLNLVVNARDAMPDGGAIRIATAAVADHVVLSVEDDGAGMDESTVSKIFEPFFTTKELGRGTGLGLSTVYGIVQQHGGTIGVVSEVGRGSRFEIRLPRSDDQPVSVAERATSAPIDLDPRVRTETILVVEDEPLVRGVVKRLLAGRGYHVIETGLPDQAIELALAHPEIALVITDVMMPGMNGRQMFERIAAERPDTRVMFMSGYDNDVLAPQGIDDGTAPGPLLRKPFDARDLLRCVDDLIDR